MCEALANSDIITIVTLLANSGNLIQLKACGFEICKL